MTGVGRMLGEGGSRGCRPGTSFSSSLKTFAVAPMKSLGTDVGMASGKGRPILKGGMETVT